MRWITAGVLATTPVLAQITGDMHRKAGYSYYGVMDILYIVFFVGLTVLVWLWVAKLWRELRHKRK